MTPFSPDRCTILVADDDHEVRSLLKEELMEEGYQVEVAKNGLDVLCEIPFHKFDLIITDWKMPLRDGMSIVRTLQEVCPGVPVILMTAYGSSKLKKEAQKAGAVYFQKPFSIEDLKGAIKKLLGSKKARY